nr:hypothetical protein [Halomonas socia]
MNWLLIAFIVALIVSPVMWLKPSPKQKRVARLREHARKAGVRVKLAAPPLHAAGKQMPSYRWGIRGGARAALRGGARERLQRRAQVGMPRLALADRAIAPAAG